MKIFVANLPFHIKDTGLIQLFGLFGAVLSARIITQNGKSKGFGFLEMADTHQAQMAIEKLDGSPINDRNIIVRPADDQEDSQKGTATPHKRARLGFLRNKSE